MTSTRNTIVVLAVLSLLALGCGDAVRTTTTDTPTTTASSVGTTVTTTTVPSTTTTTSEPAVGVDRLRSRIDETVARRTATFTLTVDQEWPAPTQFVATSLRTGTFDDVALVGEGTLRFEDDSDEVAPELDGLEFETRMIDNTVWSLNPVISPPMWAGYGFLELAVSAGGDPTASMDGDLLILQLGAATTEVTGYVRHADSSETWSVLVEADEMLPIVATGGVQQRIAEAGFESTGLKAQVRIIVDAAGMVTAFDSDLSEWWRRVTLVALPDAPAPVGMLVEFELGEFDQPLHVDAPCSNPFPITEPGAPDGLACEA